MNWLLYDFSKGLGRGVSGLFFKTRLQGFEHLPPGPGLILSNHISHFDPPCLVLALAPRVHFMTMNCLFRPFWFAWWLRQVGCFPVDPNRADFRATRKALRHLRAGKWVVIFPDGGIRTGRASVTENGPLSLGLAGLAHLANCPIYTAVILGTDRLYCAKNWLHCPEIRLTLGGIFRIDSTLPKREARRQLTQAVQENLRETYQKMVTEAPADYRPRTAQERNGFAPQSSLTHL